MMCRRQSKKRDGKNDDVLPKCPKYFKSKSEALENMQKLRIKNFIRSQYNATFQVFCLVTYTVKSKWFVKRKLRFSLRKINVKRLITGTLT